MNPKHQPDWDPKAEELLERTIAIELHPDKPPANAIYPASGFAELPLLVRSHDTK